jgi:hypothetical protein
MLNFESTGNKLRGLLDIAHFCNVLTQLMNIKKSPGYINSVSRKKI